MCVHVYTRVSVHCVLGAGIGALQWRRFYIPWSEFLVVLSLLVHSLVISSLPSQTGQCPLAPDWKRTEVGMEEGRRPDVTSHDVFVLRMPAWPCEVAQLVFPWGLFFLRGCEDRDLASCIPASDGGVVSQPTLFLKATTSLTVGRAK